MKDNFISLNNFSKSYYSFKNGRKNVFENQNLEIIAGKNIGIIGLNGSGKSTLLRLLGRIESPTSGKLESRGSISWPIGLYSGIDPELTGIENVVFICMLLGIDEKNDVIDEVFKRANIEEAKNRQVKYYSSGMRMKFTFYLCLIFDFDFFLVDEVTSVGDAKFKDASQNYMKQRTHNSTLILTSHAESNIRENCEVGCIVHDKQISEIMNVDEALKVYNEIIRSNDSANFLNNQLPNESDEELEKNIDNNPEQDIKKKESKVNEAYIRSKYER